MPTPNTPHRQPTKQEINEAVEELMFGRDWDAVAANLGLGPKQACRRARAEWVREYRLWRDHDKRDGDDSVRRSA